MLIIPFVLYDREGYKQENPHKEFICNSCGTTHNNMMEIYDKLYCTFHCYQIDDAKDHIDGKEGCEL